MTKTLKIVAVLAALFASAGLVAACGSDSKEDYAQEVEEVLQPLGDDLEQLGTQLSSAADEAELATGLQQAQDDLETAASSIEGLTVPDGVQQVNDDLVSAINGFAGELGKVREAAESGDAAELQKTALALPDVAAEFESDLNDIQNAAIDAGVPIENPGN